MKDRAMVVLKNTIIALSLLLIVGLGVITGYRVPCTFKALTGLQCPGCGMTRAVILVLNGDLHGAWQMSPFVYILPILCLYGIIESTRYIKTGAIDKRGNYLMLILAAVLLAFGIIRNI